IAPQDGARPFDPAQAIAIAIDGRVELVVRAHGDKSEATLRIADAGAGHYRRNREIGLMALGLPDPFAGTVAPIESARLEQAIVEVLELLWIGLLDQVADLAIIADPFVPEHPWIGRKRRLGHARDDRGLGEEM